MTGSGTLLDPYVIYDVNDLQAMENDLDAYYELANDIDAAATVGWNGGLGFDPIGNYSVPNPDWAFRGNFDGKRYKITDLTINRPTETYVGLFGYISLVGGVGGPSRDMKDVGLEDCDITGGDDAVAGLIGFTDDERPITNCWVTGTITIAGGAALNVLAGGLTGYCDGAVSDCFFNGTISITDTTGDRYRQMGGLIGLIGGGTVTRCYSAGQFVATGVAGSDLWELGSFAGMNTSRSISRCFSTMDISVTGDAIYGIAGFIAVNTGPITDCYARGDVTANGTAVDTDYIAGFVSWHDLDDISNCYSTGLITTNGSVGIGGLIGDIGAPGTVTDCFWDTETSGTLISGGGTGKTTAEMKDSATFIDAGWGFGTTWGMTPACNDGYACLLGVTASCAWVLAPAFRINRAHALSREEL